MIAARGCDGDGEGQRPDDGQYDGRPGRDVENAAAENSTVEEEDTEPQAGQCCWIDQVKGRLKLWIFLARGGRSKDEWPYFAQHRDCRPIFLEESKGIAVGGRMPAKGVCLCARDLQTTLRP